MLTFGSVCSGIEAASVAWEPLGMRAAWLAEIEPFPSAVLAHHYQNTPNLGDMTMIAERIQAGAVTAPDVLVGGTPCQAFSVAGIRAGLADPRGQLTLAYVGLANAIDTARLQSGQQPAIIVWENVPGVLSSKDNAFGCFLAGLAGEDLPLESPGGGKWSNAGYVLGPQRAIAWRVLDAQYFGLAQRRRRVFVVASARNGFDPSAVLFEFDGVRRDSAPSRGAAENIAGTLEASLGASRGAGTPIGALHTEVAACLDASYAKLQGASGQDLNHGHSHLVAAFGGNNQAGPIDVATARNACGSGSGRLDFETETFLVELVCVTGAVTHTLKAEGFDASEDGTGTSATDLRAGMGIGNAADPMFTLQASAQHGAVSATVCREVAQTITSNYGKQCDNSDTSFGPNLAIQIQSLAVRRLTPVECERLQGFPGDWTLIPWRNKYECQACGEKFTDKHAAGVGGLAPAECPKCGEEDRITADCPDGPRYKAIGNSMAVSVMRWIGQRIQDATKELAVIKKEQ